MLSENEIEKQARERAEKLEETQTLGVYDNDEDLARDMSWNDGEVSGYEEGFIDGAKYGMETICKKILEEVEKAGFVYFGTPTVNKLKDIIKDLGVDL